MRMRVCMLSIIALMLGIAPVMAADLPQSGSFKIHSGWKAIGETIQVAENHTLGTGNFWGITYNESGGGLYIWRPPSALTISGS